MEKLIIGLGNPEPQFSQTRHNVGKEFLNFLSVQWFTQSPQDWKKISRLPAELKQQEGLGLVKLTHYMNQAGPAVKQLLNYFKLPLEKILIVHDDTDLTLGKIKFTQQSTSAGHHGVESIINSLGSNKFSRLRIGVRPANSHQKAEFLVLSHFTPAEKQFLEEKVFPQALDWVNRWRTL